MRRRLLVVLIPLAVLLILALGVPLATVVAERETQETYVDRLNDAGRFASLAETALATGRTEALKLELDRYHDLYGIPAALVKPDGAVLHGPRAEVDQARRHAPAMDEIMSQALAGYRPDPPTAVWPWTREPLIVAEPVGRDSEMVGVVVSVSPTERLRASILASWGRLAGLVLVPLLGLVAVAWPVSRWVLRPVRRLDEATAAIAAGDLSVRAGAEGGPVELRRLAESFNAMVDVVESALHRQRAFVSDASHQLRNPLASLRLAVENLSPFLTRPAAVEAHTVALEEARSMNRMLNSLLAATRLDSLRRAEPAELDAILATRAQRWRALGADRGVGVDIDVPVGIVVLEPPGGLGSTLDELLSNALRLSGGSRVRVAAWTSGAGSDAVISVSDDGDGLDVDDRSEALRRFWRAPQHQNTVGTGLGLSICAELVDAAGGRLTLEDGLIRPAGDGHGLAVVITLPTPMALRSPVIS